MSLSGQADIGPTMRAFLDRPAAQYFGRYERGEITLEVMLERMADDRRNLVRETTR